jgi:hypothetical protein
LSRAVWSSSRLELWGLGTSLTDLRGDVALTNSTPAGLDEADCVLHDVIAHPTQYLLGLLAAR